jgi:hypothetical protein
MGDVAGTVGKSLTRRRIAHRVGAFSGIVAILVAIFGSISPADAASTPAKPAPSASPSSSASPTPASKVPTVTFGIGPANATKVDGRPYFSYFASPGGQVGDHIALVNISTQPLALNVYVADARNGSDGSLSYASRAKPPTAAGSWFAISTPSGTSAVTVPAQTTLIVPVVLKVPASASPGDHLAAFVLSLTAPSKGKNGEQVNLEQRVAAKAYVRVNGPLHPGLSIQNLRASYDSTLNPIGSGRVTVTYTVKNTGNTDLGARQKVSLSGLFGSTGTASFIAAVPLLLPGSSIKETVSLDHVRPELILRAKVTVTTEQVADLISPSLPVSSATATVWAVPWTLVAVVVVVLLAIAAWFWWRRRRSGAAGGGSAHSLGPTREPMPVA